MEECRSNTNVDEDYSVDAGNPVVKTVVLCLSVTQEESSFFDGLE